MVRIKYRYVLAELIFSDTLTSSVDSKLIYQSIADTTREFFGDIAYSKLTEGLSLKYFNPITTTCIIRASRANIGILMSSLIITNSIGSRKCKWRTIKISGTINRCESTLRRLTISWLREKERYKHIMQEAQPMHN